MTDYTLPCFCLDYTTDEDGIRPESPTEHALGANGCKYPPRDTSASPHECGRTYPWMARYCGRTRGHAGGCRPHLRTEPDLKCCGRMYTHRDDCPNA